MQNFSQLLAFGDSHTAGHLTTSVDLDSLWTGAKKLEEYDNKSKEFAFPNILSKRYNISSTNYAMSGGSTDRSIRLLPQALANNPNSLVLFSFNNIDRSEIFYPNETKCPANDSTNYLQVGINWVAKQTASLKLFHFLNKKTEHPLNDLFLRKFSYSTAGLNNYKIFNSILYVEALCKLHAADFRYFFIGKDIITDTHLQSELWDLVDNTKIIKLPGDSNQGYGSYIDFHTLNNSIGVGQGHYNKQAHIDFANYLYDNMGF
jgi:hypothetical protein